MTLSSSPPSVESVEIHFSEAFERDVLKESFRRHLPEKTIQALLSSPSKLTLLAKELGQTQATPEAVTRLVEHYFTRYFTKSREVAIVRSSGDMERYGSELESFMRSQESQELMLLLGVAGTLTPILDGDWSINRLEEAHQALSVANLGEFKQALALEIAAHNDDRTLDDNSFRAVDKGTGTGIIPHTQRQNRDIADIYREQSIGIALHHDPAELVLKNFVKPKRLKVGGEGIKIGRLKA